MTRPLAVLCSVIAAGLRHVVLPPEMPTKVIIVLEYTDTTVQHEFAPDANQLALREVAGE